MIPVIVLLYYLTPLTQEQLPTLGRLETNTVTLKLTDDFLTIDELQKNLTSGLTTTVEIVSEIRDGHNTIVLGGGIIEIRYELWDELFLIDLHNVSGEHIHQEVKSLQDLRHWFRTTDIAVADGGSLDKNTSWSAKVTLRAIPFSQKEQKRALQWVNKSIGTAASRTDGGQAGNRVLAMIVGTSIKRTSLMTFSWNLRLRPGAEP